jgi:hypothetical protein
MKMSDILDSIDDLLENEDPEYGLEGTLVVPEDGDENELLLGEIASPDMDEVEAREVTEAIRSAATATYILLSQAHEGKAYKALGYETWADYVREEFEISSQRSYQLLDLSKAVKMIEAAAPEGTVVKLTEAQARGIKKELPKITEQIAEATKGKTPEEAEEEIDRIVGDVREQKKADDKAIAEKQAKIDEAEAEGYSRGLEAAADALLEADDAGKMGSSADDEFIEMEVSGDGGSISPQDSMDLYNFFSVLTGVTSLPQPDDFVKIIPKSRANEIDNQIIEAAAWFNRFQTIWEMNKE